MKAQESVVKRLLQGAALGAILVVATGFSWWGGYGLGWHTAGTVERVADARAESAVVAVADCVARFNALPESTAMKAVLIKADSNWEYRQAFAGETAKWVTVPGKSGVDNALATACGRIAAGKPIKK